MDKEEIKQMIATSIEGQFNQVNSDNKLSVILYGIVGLL